MTDTITINGLQFQTLVAITQSEQESGLMGVKWPPPVMSFVYGSPRVNKFWMHRTPSPLDIVFCRSGKIISICAGQPNSTSLIGDDSPSDLVIELPAGTCKENGISVGSSVELAMSSENKMKLLKKKACLIA